MIGSGTLGAIQPRRPPARSMALLWAGVAGLVALILLTAYTRTQATGTLAAATMLLVVVTWRRALLAWPTLLAAIVLVILLVPIRRYTIGGGLPFALEPYRVLIGCVLAAWLLALLVDPRTRFRGTGLEAPVLALFLAIGCSLVVNTGRVGAVSGTVVKGLTFFVSFFFVMYFVSGSVTRKRALDGLAMLLVIAGTAVALSAVVEWRTEYNVFNHLDQAVPLLDYSDLGSVSTPERGDRPRAYASAQHSIALGAALVMIMPLAVYLFRRTGRSGWMAAAAVLTLGAMATGSRTAIVMLAATLVVFLVVKRTATVRLLPLLLPLFLVIQIAMPGSLGTFKAVLFPKEGLVAEEQAGMGESGSGRLADLGPGLEEWGRTPLFGQGFGTRLPSNSDGRVNALILDNQWLGSLLELGALGFIALVWLFARASRRLGRRAREDDEPHGWLLAALCASITAFAVGMFTFDAFSFTQVTFLAFIALGMGAAALRLSDARLPEAR
jgi:polysaccharide biosynthesis protein PslJ